ncbi:MAG: hypothetical protein EB127_27120 [Alphaproteobacteria bacterium]|nr:hypothetical protein [Alphaproteobacteria bacterium]
MNKIYLVTSPSLGYALFYTEFSAANLMKLQLENELGGKATITTFQSDMTFKQVDYAYHKGEFEKIDFSKLTNALGLKKTESWKFSNE